MTGFVISSNVEKSHGKTRWFIDSLFLLYYSLSDMTFKSSIRTPTSFSVVQ